MFLSSYFIYFNKINRFNMNFTVVFLYEDEFDSSFLLYSYFTFVTNCLSLKYPLKLK